MGVNDSEEVEMPNSQLGGVNAQAKDCRRHMSKEAKEETDPGRRIFHQHC
jgi:hypothetical protein